LADLVGQDATSAWHIFEAKGRQRAPSIGQSNNWKAQTQTITAVNGVAPATRSYCVGYVKRTCSIELVDPPSEPPSRPVDLRVSPEEFEVEYYRPYIESLGTEYSITRRQERSFRVQPIAVDPITRDYIFVGLEDVYAEGAQVGRNFQFAVEEIDEETFYCGTDGIVIASSSRSDKIP
jgi:hypothetical protein